MFYKQAIPTGFEGIDMGSFADHIMRHILAPSGRAGGLRHEVCAGRFLYEPHRATLDKHPMLEDV